jgi:hypothetical protein
LQEAFNAKLKTVRTEKEHLLTKVLYLKKYLKEIHVEIPLRSIKPLLIIPTINIDIEFPERKMMVRIYKYLINSFSQHLFQCDGVTSMALKPLRFNRKANNKIFKSMN